jgi:hypothetical protein
MIHPVPYIEIKTSPSIDPFLDLLGEMGVGEDDDFESF